MDRKSKDTTTLPVMLFKQQKDWTAWLDKNHAQSPGIWMRIAKKTSDLQSLSYDQTLEIALCYGWIDGQKKTYDEDSWLQKFTRRGAKSGWSKLNREKAERLVQRGLMKPAGLEAIERAKADGRWDAAYDSARSATVPHDFQAALDAHPRAKAFFATLKGTNRYAVLYRIQTAKRAETRAKRIQQFAEMLEKHETIYRRAQSRTRRGGRQVG